MRAAIFMVIGALLIATSIMLVITVTVFELAAHNQCDLVDTAYKLTQDYYIKCLEVGDGW